jgi:hypothetical protein
MASPADIRIDVPVRVRSGQVRATIFDEVARQRPDRLIACALVDGDAPAVRLLGALPPRESTRYPAHRSIFVCLEDPRSGDRIAATLDDLEAACRVVREQLRGG